MIDTVSAWRELAGVAPALFAELREMDCAQRLAVREALNEQSGGGANSRLVALALAALDEE